MIDKNLINEVDNDGAVRSYEQDDVYEIIDTITLSSDGCTYVVLRDIPTLVDGDIYELSSKRYICKILTDEQGEETLAAIQDIDIANEVMKKHQEFMEKCKDD